MSVRRSIGARGMWLGLMVLIMLGLPGCQLPPFGNPRTNRELVRDQLAQVDGVPMVLPVKIQSGYDPATSWGWETDTHGRASMRQVIFPSTDSKAPDDESTAPINMRALDGVRLCVAAGNAHAQACDGTEPPGRTIHRQIEDLQVSIWLPNKDQATRKFWQTVNLTTDLNKVTWLH